MSDISVYGKFQSLADAIRQNQERELKNRLLQSEVNKNNILDADKIGEQAILKAAQGIPLTPQEQAAAQFVNAKSALPVFNPVTGAQQNRESISSRMGINLGGKQPDNVFTPPGVPSSAPPPMDAFEAQYQSMLGAASGNPKLQQSIKDEYAKSKLKFNEDQAKSAGFTDRMNEAMPVISDNQEAGTSYYNHLAGSLPIIGNALVSDEYQKLDQAQRNFINAQLRRESGAAISDSEFDNAKKQYFPQPGDTPETLLQKAQNRMTATQAMQRASGAAYVPSDLYAQGKAKFDASKKPRLKYNPQTGDFE